MRYCTGCGKELQDGQTFCTGCGKAAQQSSEAQSGQRAGFVPVPRPGAQAQAPAPSPIKPSPPKKRSRAPLIIAISVLVLALAAAAIWFFLLRDTDRDDADDSEDEKTEQKDKKDSSKTDASAVAADRVAFDVRYDDQDREYAVITAYGEDDEVLWTVETPRYDTSQIARVNEIGIQNDLYYYIDDGDVVALSLADGEELWRNDAFKGGLGDFVFGDNGALYLCGYFGPDLFVINRNGATVERIATLKDDFLWPYDIRFNGDGDLVITYEQVGAGGDEGTITLDPDKFEILAVTGESSAAASHDGPPTSVTLSASSTFHQTGYDYSPKSAMDGDASTAWVEGVSGDGTGESLTLDFGSVCTVNTIQIWAGYQKGESLYEKNNRPERVRLTFSDGSSREIVLKDVYGMQSIDLGGDVQTASITITILSVYAGSAYDDTAISEIRLY